MGKVKLECDFCGQEIERFPSDINGEHGFCSRDCSQAFRIYQSYRTISCDNCGKKIHRKKSDIRDTHNFCSPECSQEFQQTGKKTVKCDQCGKEVKRWPYQIKNNKLFFCSKKCQGEWNTENQSGQNHPNHEEKINVKCAACGSKVEIYPYQIERSDNFFCSRQCHNKWRSKNLIGQENPNWRGGSTYYYGPNYREQRKKARKRDNYTCQICGVTSEGATLQVHHFIPFRTFRYPIFKGEVRNPLVEFDWKRANRLENLITVCVACHGKLENNVQNEQD